MRVGGDVTKVTLRDVGGIFPSDTISCNTAFCCFGWDGSKNKHTLALSFMNSHSEIQRTLPFLLSGLWCVIRSRVCALLPGGIPTLAWGLSLMWRWPCRIMSTCYQAGHSHAMRTTNRRKKSAASNLVPMLGRGHEFAHSAGVMSRRPVFVCGLQHFTSALKLLLVEMIF